MANDSNSGEKEIMAEIFESKKDIWLTAILWALVALAGGTAVVVLMGTPSGPVNLSAALVLACGGAFVLWVLLGTRYILSRDRLTVQAGPLRWAIPLDSIEEVRPVRSLLSAPALSLDRLSIRRSGAHPGLLVSPRDSRAFLRRLSELSPGLRADGDGLRRDAGPRQ